MDGKAPAVESRHAAMASPFGSFKEALQKGTGLVMTPTTPRKPKEKTQEAKTQEPAQESLESARATTPTTTEAPRTSDSSEDEDSVDIDTKFCGFCYHRDIDFLSGKANDFLRIGLWLVIFGMILGTFVGFGVGYAYKALTSPALACLVKEEVVFPPPPPPPEVPNPEPAENQTNNTDEANSTKTQNETMDTPAEGNITSEAKIDEPIRVENDTDIPPSNDTIEEEAPPETEPTLANETVVSDEKANPWALSDYYLFLLLILIPIAVFGPFPTVLVYFLLFLLLLFFIPFGYFLPPIAEVPVVPEVTEVVITSDSVSSSKSTDISYVIAGLDQAKLYLIVFFDNKFFSPVESYLVSSFGNWCNILLYGNDKIADFEKSAADFSKTIFIYLHVSNAEASEIDGNYNIENYNRLRKLSDNTRFAIASEVTATRGDTPVFTKKISSYLTLNFYYFGNRVFAGDKDFVHLSDLILKLRRQIG